MIFTGVSWRWLQLYRPQLPWGLFSMASISFFRQQLPPSNGGCGQVLWVLWPWVLERKRKWVGQLAGERKKGFIFNQESDVAVGYTHMVKRKTFFHQKKNVSWLFLLLLLYPKKNNLILLLYPKFFLLLLLLFCI